MRWAGRVAYVGRSATWGRWREGSRGAGCGVRKHRTIDITTTGRRSGQPRRIEICFYRVGDSIYLSGVPGPRTRDWLVNLAADPHLTFHLKHEVKADLPAKAQVIADPAERSRVLTPIVEDFNDRNGGPDSPWPTAVLEEWVERSPLALVSFEESD
jgi:deazaflavin-dependent oxidoreductase (nitroreductase family)